MKTKAAKITQWPGLAKKQKRNQAQTWECHVINLLRQVKLLLRFSNPTRTSQQYPATHYIRRFVTAD